MDKKTDTIKRRYDRIAKIYGFIEGHMDMVASSEGRREVFNGLSGKVLEVGVGTGKNIEHYHDGIEVTAIDFSPKMLKQAREKANKLNQKVDLIEMDAQRMSFPDNSFDFVVTSCVFCSVPDPIKGFQEIHRVLKPGGKAILIEHVRSEKPVLGLLMDLLNPVTVFLHGANINRRTEENIKSAGFTDLKVTNLWGDIVKKFVITKI